MNPSTSKARVGGSRRRWERPSPVDVNTIRRLSGVQTGWAVTIDVTSRRGTTSYERGEPAVAMATST